MEQTKIITNQSQWNTVAGELSKENMKLMSYDKTLLSLLKFYPGMNNFSSYFNYFRIFNRTVFVANSWLYVYK